MKAAATSGVAVTLRIRAAAARTTKAANDVEAEVATAMDRRAVTDLADAVKMATNRNQTRRLLDQVCVIEFVWALFSQPRIVRIRTINSVRTKQQNF